jgi:alginate O-acetyltransferase complex protein AlgI
MLFNSWEFLLVFLPVTFAVYFLLSHNHYDYLSKAWLFLGSLVFYGWFNPGYLFIILSSILVNFSCARMLLSSTGRRRKTFLVLGIVFNILLLGYYKYADFFIDNFNLLFEQNYNLLNIILPLGISFFTFQQIAYLVDAYKERPATIDFIYYGAFVSFFPSLISGPISHHAEIMPQFKDPSRRYINPANIATGLLVFNMGLAKKIIIADTFGKIVSQGYGNFEQLSLEQSWITAFAYTVQLYFDFSGYSDMAIGLGLFFNIQLPINFNSPHRSENIQQFYRRWHMTLSSFMKNYIYIPLGGNKMKEWRINLNLFITFLIGGFWHGANWTFVVWGALNGLALVAHRLYKKAGFTMNQYMAIAVTFVFVLIVRVFFRADGIGTANTVLLTMFGLREPEGSITLFSSYFDAPIWLAGVLLLFMPNTNEIRERFVPNPRFALMLSLLMVLNLVFMNSVEQTDFLYFDF